MPDDKPQTPQEIAQGRRPYRAPEIHSDDLFESKGLACLKVNTMGPGDCSNLLPGSSKTS